MSAAFTFALAALVAAPTPRTDSAPAPQPAALIADWVRQTDPDRPRVNLWVDRDDPYRRGDEARVYFKVDRDAYVTVVRIDTDRRIRVLFPIDPWEDNFARGGRTFEVLGRDRDEAFRVDDYPGVGYVFAIASDDPFDYDDVVRGDHWDYRAISDGRVRGDPYVAVSDLAERVAREGYYDYDVAEYYVDQHYDYPRFVCYDCHSYASWHYWDPYSSYCSRFRIVIYNDWYYYPYRRYPGSVVIYGRPYRPGPRYVFKDADPRNDYITRVANRPRTDPVGPRRPVGDRTSADVGGRGSIPAPVTPRRRTDATGRGDSPDRTAPNEPRRRAPDAAPGRDNGSARPEPGQEPRRRTDQPRNQVDQPRSAPRPDGAETGRRRGIEERPNVTRPSDRGSGDRGRATPERRDPGTRSGDGPSRREPSIRSNDRPERRETSRPGVRQSRPEVRQSPPERRAEPQRRSEPRAERPAPRSTGEPQLKRRRPND